MWHCFLFSAAALLVGVPLATAQEKDGAPKTRDADGRHWGKPVEGQAVSIATDKSAYAPSERIGLNIRFKNVNKTDLPIRWTYPLQLYEVSVSLVEGPHRRALYDTEEGPTRVLPDSGHVPHTLYGKLKYESSRGGSVSSVKLKPNNYRESWIDLTRLFDMSLEGKYVVTVWGPVFKDGGFWRKNGVLQRTASNDLEITIDGRLGHGSWLNLGTGPKEKDLGKAKRLEAKTPAGPSDDQHIDGSDSARHK
jgi:hypothetical protein